MNNHHRVEQPLSTLLGTGSSTATESPLMPAYAPQQQQQDSYKNKPNYYMPTPQRITSTTASDSQSNSVQQQSLDPSSALVTNWNRGNEIDFNSLEFLYDTGLFGQVVFDVNTSQSTPMNSGGYPQQQPLYQSMLQSQQPQQSPQSYLPNITTSLPIHHSQETSSPAVSSAATPTTANTPSAFQSMIPQTTNSSTSTPTAYNPSKSLWN
jgi:hypothetical protein